MSKFKKDNVNPMPGLQINADGHIGVIKIVSGGRVLVDFNHQLAGKDLIYEVNAIKKVEDKKIQIEALLKLILNFKAEDVRVKEKEADIDIKMEIPPQILENVANKIKELVGLENVHFNILKQKAKAQPKQAKTE